MMPSRFIAAKSGRIMSECERFTTLLPANAHAGSEKNKAAARKIDNLITISKRSGTYPTTATDLQEHLLPFARSCSHRPVAGHANLEICANRRPTGPWLQRRQVSKLV